MGDFIGHLIKRNLTDAAQVQPRLPNLFESGLPVFEPDVLSTSSSEWRVEVEQNDRASVPLKYESGTPSHNAASLVNSTLPSTLGERQVAADIDSGPAPWLSPRRGPKRGQPTIETDHATTLHDKAPIAKVDATKSEVLEMQPQRDAAAIHLEDLLASTLEQPRTQFDDRIKHEAERQNFTTAPLQSQSSRVKEFDTPGSIDTSNAQSQHLQDKTATKLVTGNFDTRLHASFLVRGRAAMSSNQPHEFDEATSDRPVADKPNERAAVLSPISPRADAGGIRDAEQAQAILVPRQQPEAASHDHSPPSSAEPVVQVTIGRVEVRAVSAPPVRKRAGPSKPALSLGDYLDRRGGGQR